MYFKLIYSDKKLYHARLYNAAGQILFWTTEHTTKQPVINVCDEVRSNMKADTPIYDV
jgi:uncharacterized protein YegP (UPF0339 family)